MKNNFNFYRSFSRDLFFLCFFSILQKMPKRHRSLQSSDTAPTLHHDSSIDTLVHLFSTIPGNVIYEYAREFSGKRKRIWKLSNPVTEWVQWNDALFFKYLNDQTIYSFDVLHSKSLDIKIVCDEMVDIPTNEICQLWSENKLVDTHLLTTQDYLLQWNSFHILIHTCNDDYIHSLESENIMVCCFWLTKNQFVIGTNNGAVSVYDIVHAKKSNQLYQWFTLVYEPILKGCAISDCAFAIGYEHFIDIWSSNGNRLQTLACNGSLQCCVSLNRTQLVIGTSTGSEIWQDFNGEYFPLGPITMHKHMGNKPVISIMKSNYSNHFACLCDDGSIYIYKNGSIHKMLDYPNPIQKCLWLDNEYLVTMSGNDLILWE